MGWIELLLVAVGLSMDAFAVAMCKGLCMLKIDRKQACFIALFFGGFQALMPLTGYYIGGQFERNIVRVDHWVILALLAFIGGKMIYDSMHTADSTEACDAEKSQIGTGELFVLAVATSIDALAVGITFALLGAGMRMTIYEAVLTIGATTFVLSFAGVAAGCRFGTRYRSKAEAIGGIVLIAIGVKILLEHMLGL